ncbi:MAG: serine hydrolase [Prevotellaceae bacterium]|jgi:beta-glucosidase-like glycosyl hydrolase/CubicO group peptidase (beta-lactamase class C family)|nr:serine hydrolase [Prevotellaceae bacterium]
MKVCKILWVLAVLTAAAPCFPQTAPFLPESADDACRQWVDSVMRRMSLEEKLGQSLIMTLPARATKQQEKRLREAVKRYKIGGLLFGHGTVEEQAQLTNLAQRAAKVPLLVTFDGEWGLSMRLDSVPDFPRAAALGCIGDVSRLYDYGREMAREFRLLGVQVNFAPDADVNTNPLNPVINTRSFGEQPEGVARRVIAYAQGLESGGVLSVSKHFPGHGDTDVDSHKALPTLKFDRARLEAIELYPFRRAIGAGLGGMMVGHLRVPVLEPDASLPSSVSRRIVTGLLQEEMGFRGLVFTDALEMRGVSTVPQVTLKAYMAGNDMLLAQRNLERGMRELTAAVRSGTLPLTVVDAKCRKILTYKYLLGLRHPRPKLTLEGLHARICTPEAEELAAKLHAEAITVLGNRFGVLPLAPPAGRPIGILSVGAGSDSLFVEELQSLSPVPVERLLLTKETDEAGRQAIAAQLARYSRIIVVTSGNSSEMTEYFDFLSSLRPSAPLVYLFLNSYRAAQLLEGALRQAGAVVLGHAGNPVVQRRAAHVLFGKAPAHGRLSMSIGTLYGAGQGIDLEVTTPAKESLAEDVGIRSIDLQALDDIARLGIDSMAYPGCQLLVIKNGRTVYEENFGTHSYADTSAVRATDLFDLGTLSASTGTLLAVMKLLDEGRLELTDRLSAHVPSLRKSTLKELTIRQLLYHESGLQPHLRFYLEAINANSVHGPYAQGWKDQWHQTQVTASSYFSSDFTFKKNLISKSQTPTHTLHVAADMWLSKSFRENILRQIERSERDQTPRYIYSDLNFILLQQVVEGITGTSLESYLSHTFYTPMGLTRTAYLPLRTHALSEIMPTSSNDFLRRQDLHGYVHDPSAAMMGGIAGHAGLFSTAREVAALYGLLLSGGEFGGRRYLSEATCRLFTQTVLPLHRRIASAPKEAFGAVSPTGTAVWADSQHQLLFVFLSNALCPQAWNTKLRDEKILRRIRQTVYEAMPGN